MVDQVWGKDRPQRPNEKVKALSLGFSGKKFQEKVDDLRKELEKKKSAGLVVCKSPAITLVMVIPANAINNLLLTSNLLKQCWMRLLGYSTSEGMSTLIKGLFISRLQADDHSIPYNPVFFSYATITPTAVTLYIDSSKLSEEVRGHLGDSVQVKPYDAIFEDNRALGKSLTSQSTNGNGPPKIPKKKFMISTKASWALILDLGGEDNVEEVRSPIGDAKAIKNNTELEGMRQCHIRDGAALCEYFAWLEEELVVKRTEIDEVQGADKLEQIRS